MISSLDSPLIVEELERLAIAADVSNIRKASDWLQQVCTHGKVPDATVSRLDLCLNEVLANIVFHGGPTAAASPVEIALGLYPPPLAAEVKLCVSDAGEPFDPLAATAKPRPEMLAEATPGGLGLTMITGYCDAMHYDFRNGRNHLTLIFSWNRPA